MIRAVEIKNVRGIQQGKLEGLKKLNILVGPNGSGKSTILDCLLMGCSEHPGRAIYEVFKLRHSAGFQIDLSELFLFRATQASIKIEGDDFKRMLHFKSPDQGLTHTTGGKIKGHHLEEVRFWVDGEAQKGKITHLEDGEFMIESPTLETFVDTALVDPANKELPIALLYSDHSKRKQRQIFGELIGEVLSNVGSVELLTNKKNEPILYVVDTEERVFPLGLAGDGVVGLANIGLHLLAQHSDLLLIEEPEVHQHFQAMRSSAELILKAAREGAQIVLATHSLEFIDYLIDLCDEDLLNDFVVFNFLLNDQVLKYGWLSGPDAKYYREASNGDFR